MKKNIFKSLFMSVLCILAVSCEDTDDFVNTLDTNKTQIMFSIGMDSPIARSRTWGDYDPSDGGDAYDNRINPDQLYVKITYGGQTYDVEKILKWQDKDNLSSHTFVGEVDIDLKGQTKTMENARIEVFANWNPEANDGDVFGQNAEYIPMWGVQTDTITLAPGKRETLNTISLIRAMAKLQVNLTKDMFNEYALQKVTLNKHNTTGFCLPTGNATAQHTTKLGLEEVLNPKTDANQSALELPVVVENSMYVVYLPEVKNDGETDEDLLKITVQLAQKVDGKVTDNIEEGSFFIKDYSDAENPKVIDIVRNHWYKYEIKGFAASEIQLNYAVLDWQNKSIEIGGDGFLFLNKDVIEIYNSNIDADQLKFSSSSPIKSIELKDLYTHDSDGNIIEGTTDGVSAYYISKYGQKVQLGTDPGFDITDKENALAKEAIILSNISATAQTNTLNGGITIKSPFLADPDNEITELQQNSHYDTPRYLEFLVTNEQDQTATFRVIQYPPVVITNIEGYFSYRDDFSRKDGESPAYWTNHMGPGSISLLAVSLVHEHDWTNEANRPQSWWDTRASDRDYSWLSNGQKYPWLGEVGVDNACPQTKGYEKWEEIRYAFIASDEKFKSINGKDTGKEFIKSYSGGYRPYGPNGESEGYATDFFVRHRFKNLPGYELGSMEQKGVAVGPYYNRVVEIDGVPTERVFRKHYTWNVQAIFFSKYVSKVYLEEGKNASNRKRLQGQADITSIMDGSSPHSSDKNGNITSFDDEGNVIYDIATDFSNYSTARLYRNHRMYHIKTTTTSDKYTLGVPTLVDENGNPTKDTERGIVQNTPSNARRVSPSLMLASQLGETDYNGMVAAAAGQNYAIPTLSWIYKLGERHCREYVESTFEDLNGNGQPDPTDRIVQYHDWRLPTKAEIEMIIDFQTNSRAMDKVLLGQYFLCVTGNPGDGDNEEYWVSDELPKSAYQVSAAEDLDGIAYNNTGYYIRCVRDVKPNENK